MNPSLAFAGIIYNLNQIEEQNDMLMRLLFSY